MENYYELADCKKHGHNVQHAVTCGFRICVQCAVQAAINTGEVLLPEPEPVTVQRR